MMGRSSRFAVVLFVAGWMPVAAANAQLAPQQSTPSQPPEAQQTTDSQQSPSPNSTQPQQETPQNRPAASVPAAKTTAEDRPLPDIPTLMHAVEANERTSEAIKKNYLFRSVQTEQQSDGHGGVKHTEVKEYDEFWAEGVPVERLTKKDGKDLSEEEQKKESERIDKEGAKAREKRAKADSQGKPSDPRGDDEITVSRLLELGSFTNPRRVQWNGRDTIIVDFTGNPRAKTRNRGEDVVRDLAGSAWIDEQDKVLVKVQGHFVNAFKIGGGLLVNIQKGTNFGFEQKKINDEVWLPSLIGGQGEARALLLFKFNGSLQAVESDYRKFRATSTILPGVNTVDESAPKP